MNKKDYLALMQEYEIIIEEKCFNPNFFNEKRLEELKKTINRQLSYYERICLAHNIQSARHLYAPLMQKIKDGESIQSYRYEECYIELHMLCIGPFKLKHIQILCLIGGGAFIARWFLSYLGLI